MDAQGQDLRLHPWRRGRRAGQGAAIASRCVSAGLSPLTRQSAGSRLTVVKPVD
jgi:hypothetical protein